MRVLGAASGPLHAAGDAAASFPAPVANMTFSNEEPPFDPPEDDDNIFGCDDDVSDADDAFPAHHAEEEEDLTLLPPAPAADEAPALTDASIALTEDEQPDPFEAAMETPAALAAEPPPSEDRAAPDQEPPFDAPDADDDVFGATYIRQEAAPEPEPEPLPAPRLPAQRAPAPQISNGDCPAPPIHIHASWDRPEIGQLLEAFAADSRLARADVEIARGGVDSAVMRFAVRESPNLLIIDTTLRRAEMLKSLDRLAQTIDPDCKIIILGALNDIGLLRELAARGVSEYIVPPLKPEDLARAVCRLYAENDQSRVIAVIGARGGVGASTIAQNLAWSIAERQDACAALIDLDLAFGAAAFNLGIQAERSIADALFAPEGFDAGLLAHATAQHTKHLQVLTAPASLDRTFELAPNAVEALIHHVRRANPFVVLDLPHEWSAWVKHALACADEIVLAASPDLASLRNAKAMLDALSPLRAGKSAPAIALSMVGMPKRPEINAKDFTEAVGLAPAASFAFEPTLYGLCETQSRMIGQAEPEGRAAAALDALAAQLTGRKPAARKRAPDEALLARDGAADFARSPKRGARELAAGAANDNVLVLSRETSIGHLAASLPHGAPEGAYLAQARNAAQAHFATHASSRARPRANAWVRVGLAAGAAAVALAGGAWRAQSAATELAPTPRAAQAGVIAAAATSLSEAEAAYAAALVYQGQGRAAEAAASLRAAAEAGHALAQHRLGQAYQRGEGVEADPARARLWTERAAARGVAAAMHDLGVFAAESADYAGAFRWFRQGAEFGVADSQFNLGVMYAEGAGVSADAGEAMFWFLTAAATGDLEAGARAESLRPQLSAQALEQAQARARAFRPRVDTDA